MLEIDWPMDMHARMDTVIAQVVRAFGYIKPHCVCLFCNKRGHRMKVLVHDELSIWLCARRLEQSNQRLDAKIQQLEISNQNLDSKVQHISILTQKYEHELALFKRHKFAQKKEHLTAEQIHLWDEAVSPVDYRPKCPCDYSAKQECQRIESDLNQNNG